MTIHETVVSISQTLLRANGRWGRPIDEVLRRDIRATVDDVIRLLRVCDGDVDLSRVIDGAVKELERRATPASLSVG